MIKVYTENDGGIGGEFLKANDSLKILDWKLQQQSRRVKNPCRSLLAEPCCPTLAYPQACNIEYSWVPTSCSDNIPPLDINASRGCAHCRHSALPARGYAGVCFQPCIIKWSQGRGRKLKAVRRGRAPSARPSSARQQSLSPLPPSASSEQCV